MHFCGGGSRDCLQRGLSCGVDVVEGQEALKASEAHTGIGSAGISLSRAKLAHQELLNCTASDIVTSSLMTFLLR